MAVPLVIVTSTRGTLWSDLLGASSSLVQPTSPPRSLSSSALLDLVGGVPERASGVAKRACHLWCEGWCHRWSSPITNLYRDR